VANVEDVERVYRETFILTTLKHQHIIKLFEVLDTPKSIMLVMEYAGGGELFSYVSSKGRLSEAESCRLFQQIIGGVECQSSFDSTRMLPFSCTCSSTLLSVTLDQTATVVSKSARLFSSLPAVLFQSSKSAPAWSWSDKMARW
jgi:serine/threonine protein kinase